MARRGFSLVELLVSIAIVSIVITMLLPAVQKVREHADRLRCESNMRQVCVAANTHVDWMGAFPTHDAPASGWSAFFDVLGALEQKSVQDQCSTGTPETNAGAAAVIPTLLCATDRHATQVRFTGAGPSNANPPNRDYGPTSVAFLYSSVRPGTPKPDDLEYVEPVDDGEGDGNLGLQPLTPISASKTWVAFNYTGDGIVTNDVVTPIEVRDGFSNTFLLAHTRSIPTNVKVWAVRGGGAAVDLDKAPNTDPAGVQTPHNSLSFGSADASVRRYSLKTSLAVLRAHTTRADGD